MKEGHHLFLKCALWMRLPDLLGVVDEYRQLSPTDAEEWTRRITGWARFNAVREQTEPSA